MKYVAIEFDPPFGLSLSKSVRYASKAPFGPSTSSGQAKRRANGLPPRAPSAATARNSPPSPSGCAEERSGRWKKGRALSEPKASLRAPQRLRAPQVAPVRPAHRGRRQRGRLSLATFFGEAKKVDRPPGRDPANSRPVGRTSRPTPRSENATKNIKTPAPAAPPPAPAPSPRTSTPVPPPPAHPTTQSSPAAPPPAPHASPAAPAPAPHAW